MPTPEATRPPLRDRSPAGGGARARHERALVEALRERRIAGAMLDVHEQFGLTPSYGLSTLENVILTPHLAGLTIARSARMAIEAAKEMLRMLAGRPPKNFVKSQSLDKKEGL